MLLGSCFLSFVSSLAQSTFRKKMRMDVLVFIGLILNGFWGCETPENTMSDASISSSLQDQSLISATLDQTHPNSTPSPDQDSPQIQDQMPSILDQGEPLQDQQPNEVDQFLPINDQMLSPPLSNSNLAWFGPTSLSGKAGSTQSIEIELKTHQIQSPLDGWTLLFSSDSSSSCSIRDLVVHRTASAEAERDASGLVRGGIVHSQVLNQGRSAFHSVILSLHNEMTLPRSNQVPLVRLLLNLQFPRDLQGTQCTLHLLNTLQVGQRELHSILVSQGQSTPVHLSPLTIQLTSTE